MKTGIQRKGAKGKFYHKEHTGFLRFGLAISAINKFRGMAERTVRAAGRQPDSLGAKKWERKLLIC
jgi:hypothetical protein